MDLVLRGSSILDGGGSFVNKLATHFLPSEAADVTAAESENSFD